MVVEDQPEYNLLEDGVFYTVASMQIQACLKFHLCESNPTIWSQFPQ